MPNRVNYCKDVYDFSLGFQKPAKLWKRSHSQSQSQASHLANGTAQHNEMALRE